MGFRLTNNAFFANLFSACLELRLNQADTGSLIGGNRLSHGENMLQGNKRYIHAEKFNRLFKHIQSNIPDVCAFHVDDPFIRAQFPCQLTVTHVHRIHLPGAVLQHAIGETSRRCTNIHANLPVGSKRKSAHGFFQLQPTTAHITDIMTANLHFCVRRNHFTGLVGFLFVYKYDARHD